MAIPAIELVYFAGCPNVEKAREQLARAFLVANLPPRWVEYRTDDPALPDHARGFGSPTILVDGRDVAGLAPDDSAPACRLYVDDSGALTGVPSVASIASALAAGRR